jgi:hypothetical protein
VGSSPAVRTKQINDLVKGMSALAKNGVTNGVTELCADGDRVAGYDQRRD